jgi:gluconate 2-dehydrogenase
VLVFRELPSDQLARVQAEHDVVVANPRIDAQRAAFFDALPSTQGLIGSSFGIDAAVLAQAPKLEVVSSISVGVDNYDIPAFRQRGLMLCHTPGVLTETTADTIFALIMASSRRIVELANHVRDGHWRSNIGDALFGWDVHGKTLGIVGFGRIGQALARRAALGFRMPVVFHNNTALDLATQAPELADRARQVSLDELLKRADIVALTVPLSDETRGLMNARRFAAMRPGAIFVNGSRGPIVDEAALLAALDKGHLRAAGLDVFAVEPLPQDSPLRRHAKVTTLPHIGSATHETRHAMAVLAVDNLLAALAGRTPTARYV